MHIYSNPIDRKERREGGFDKQKAKKWLPALISSDLPHCKLKKKKKEFKRHSMYTGPLGNVLIVIVIMAHHGLSIRSLLSSMPRTLHAVACFDPRKSSEVHPMLTLAVGQAVDGQKA